MSLTPAEVVRVCAAAREYVGCPCLFQGRTKAGIDCIGILECSYVDAGPFESGFVEPTPPNYRANDLARFMRVLLRWARPLEKGERLSPADIVVYNFQGAVHIALLVDGNPLNAIHAGATGVVTETRFDPKRGDITGMFRWRR